MPDQTGTEATRKHAVARPRSSRVAPRIVVDVDLCKSCGICVQLCPVSVFDRDRKGRPTAVRADDCTACRFCEQHCPDFAIEVFQSGGTRERKAAAAKSTASPKREAAPPEEGA